MSYMSERSLEIKEKAKKVGIVILLVIAFLLLEISINIQNKKEAEENNYINYLEQKVGGQVQTIYEMPKE